MDAPTPQKLPNYLFNIISRFEGPGALGTGPQPNVAPRVPKTSQCCLILTYVGQLLYICLLALFLKCFCQNLPNGLLEGPGAAPPPGLPTRSTCDPHLYARKGLPRTPQDQSTRGPKDKNTGPEDWSIRLLCY